jgi:hypothetical protein
VEANRIRTGGLWGFFAKEGYEVLVEDDAPGTVVVAPSDANTELSRPAIEREQVLARLADEVSDAERQAPASRVSTEGPAFQAVLARVVDEVGGSRPRASDTIGEAPAEDDGPPFEPWPTVSGARRDEVRGNGAEWTPPFDAYRAARSAALVAATVAATVSTTRTPGSLPVLARLGLPEELIDPAADVDVLTSLARALDGLPRPTSLPRGPGSVIAVVGERTEALGLATTLAASIDIDPESVLLASPTYPGPRVPTERRIGSTAAAAEARMAWRRRPGPTVVAVDCPVGRATTWASHVLAALEPTMTWGTVAAHRKPEDIEAWADRLGGLDALAATGIDDTESPAAVLRTGIPVGLLDEHPASAARWAAVLTDRLALQ